MPETIKYTYEEIENKCVDIFNKIKQDGFKVDYILGISVGGLFPSIIFARLFNTKNFSSISVCSYTEKVRGDIKVINIPDKELLKGKNVLIVDDIADSGSTIKFVSELLKKDYSVMDARTAVILINKSNCKYYPNYSNEEIDQWIDFPWDKFEKK